VRSAECEILVRFFARARELAEVSEVRLPLPPAATVGQLRNALASRFPALAPLLERCALAVNEAYADDPQPLPDGATVAVIPPVSGGQ
jgi:molybdopterin converting factor subunit 1